MNTAPPAPPGLGSAGSSFPGLRVRQGVSQVPSLQRQPAMRERPVGRPPQGQHAAVRCGKPSRHSAGALGGAWRAWRCRRSTEETRT